MRHTDKSSPTWYAHNARKQPMNHETTLAYLPMIDQPATEPQAVYKCMKVMQLTMQQLDQTPTVIYMDQAMYALGQEVLWANSDLDDKVLMMAGFHLSMNSMAAIGTYVW